MPTFHDIKQKVIAAVTDGWCHEQNKPKIIASEFACQIIENVVNLIDHEFPLEKEGVPAPPNTPSTSDMIERLLENNWTVRFYSVPPLDNATTPRVMCSASTKNTGLNTTIQCSGTTAHAAVSEVLTKAYLTV